GRPLGRLRHHGARRAPAVLPLPAAGDGPAPVAGGPAARPGDGFGRLRLRPHHHGLGPAGPRPRTTPGGPPGTGPRGTRAGIARGRNASGAWTTASARHQQPDPKAAPHRPWLVHPPPGLLGRDPPGPRTRPADRAPPPIPSSPPRTVPVRY